MIKKSKTRAILAALFTLAALAAFGQDAAPAVAEGGKTFPQKVIEFLTQHGGVTVTVILSIATWIAHVWPTETNVSLLDRIIQALAWIRSFFPENKNTSGGAHTLEEMVK